MNKFLLFVKAVFLRLGIEIKFVRKPHPHTPLEHNSLSNTDNYYNSPEIIKELQSKETVDFQEKIMELLKSRTINLDNKSIADVSCGIGSLLMTVNKHFKPATNTGFEFSTAALSVAAKLFPPAEYIEFDLLKDVTEKKFDFIFCTEVLEHLSDPYIALEKIIGMVDQKGGLFMTVPNGRKDTYEGHINFWSPESWEVFIKRHAKGFSVETGSIANYSLYCLCIQE
jgi:2-polyprenyl-3-methyl-5-hydroxy-6-metoxy-1,4-benzoquinol methylase